MLCCYSNMHVLSKVLYIHQDLTQVRGQTGGVGQVWARCWLRSEFCSQDGSCWAGRRGQGRSNQRVKPGLVGGGHHDSVRTMSTGKVWRRGNVCTNCCSRAHHCRTPWVKLWLFWRHGVYPWIQSSKNVPLSYWHYFVCLLKEKCC